MRGFDARVAHRRRARGAPPTPGSGLPAAIAAHNPAFESLKPQRPATPAKPTAAEALDADEEFLASHPNRVEVRIQAPLSYRCGPQAALNVLLPQR